MNVVFFPFIVIEWIYHRIHSSSSELTSKHPRAQEVLSHICSADVPEVRPSIVEKIISLDRMYKTTNF